MYFLRVSSLARFARFVATREEGFDAGTEIRRDERDAFFNPEAGLGRAVVRAVTARFESVMPDFFFDAVPRLARLAAASRRSIRPFDLLTPFTIHHPCKRIDARK